MRYEKAEPEKDAFLIEYAVEHNYGTNELKTVAPHCKTPKKENRQPSEGWDPAHGRTARRHHTGMLIANPGSAQGGPGSLFGGLELARVADVNDAQFAKKLRSVASSQRGRTF